jgi:hypothetical protein
MSRMHLGQKTVVPRVRARIKRHRSKEHNHWLLELVGNCDRPVERRIVHGALGSLHPKGDILAVTDGCARLAYRDALVLKHLFNRIHRLKGRPVWDAISSAVPHATLHHPVDGLFLGGG